MTRSLRSAALLAVLSALAPSPAVATNTVPVTAEALALRSDDVVVATVRSSESRWERGLIVTDHELAVDAVVRGPARVGAAIFVRTPGGVVGRIAQVVPDAPALEVGRTYVFFLSGGVGPVRFLAHLTAAVVPVRASPGGGLTAQPSPTLLVDRSLGGASPPLALPAMLDRLRAVPR